jgi:hypothetical protein
VFHLPVKVDLKKVHLKGTGPAVPAVTKMTVIAAEKNEGRESAVEVATGSEAEVAIENTRDATAQSPMKAAADIEAAVGETLAVTLTRVEDTAVVEEETTHVSGDAIEIGTISPKKATDGK